VVVDHGFDFVESNNVFTLSFFLSAFVYEPIATKYIPHNFYNYYNHN